MRDLIKDKDNVFFFELAQIIEIIILKEELKLIYIILYQNQAKSFLYKLEIIKLLIKMI